MLEAFDRCEVESGVCGLCGGPLIMKDEHSASCSDCGTFHGEQDGFLLPIF
jgi:hypothetical protein